MILFYFSVSLQDIHMRKAFKSSVVFDQQVVSRDTMPTAMLETYRTCDKPPPLDKLNSYRLVNFYVQEYLDYHGYCCHEKCRNNRIRDNQDE
jgi:hypothetical protein